MNEAERQEVAPDMPRGPQAAAAQPQPAAELPEPPADAPEPAATGPEPTAAEPEPTDAVPAAAESEPVAAEPQPAAEAPASGEPGEGGAFDLAEAADADPRSKAELLAELMEAEARRDEYLDDVRRARAEFENFRKRVMRDGVTQRDLGKAAVVGGLLEVLDDVDRTLEAAGSSDDHALARGVELMAGKLVQALQAAGLERIDATGVPFDPGQHEAVQQQEAGEPIGEPTVAQVLRAGYRLGDRVLRPAMVVIEQ